MENCKADNNADKFFTQVIGNRVSDYYARNVYIKFFLQIAVSVNVSAIKNTSSKQQIRSKIPIISVTQTLNPNPEKPGLRKPGPCKTWTQKNLDSEKPGP